MLIYKLEMERLFSVLVLMVSLLGIRVFMKAPDDILKSWFDIQSRFTYFLALLVLYLVSAVVVVDVSLSFMLAYSDYLAGCGAVTVINPMNPVVYGLSCGHQSFSAIDVRGFQFNSELIDCPVRGDFYSQSPCDLAKMLQSALFVFGLILSIYYSTTKQFEERGPITKKLRF